MKAGYYLCYHQKKRISYFNKLFPTEMNSEWNDCDTLFYTKREFLCKSNCVYPVFSISLVPDQIQKKLFFLKSKFETKSK